MVNQEKGMTMPTLYYVHDPMCSWCYAFAPVWRRIEAEITGSIAVHYVVGGLAPDSDQPMPLHLQDKIKNTWHRIQAAVPGTEFNFDFWTHCEPRRSTYPACRAVLAAKHFGPEYEVKMIERIQLAYYREARNPSDVATLCELAGEIGIDVDAFGEWMNSEACQALLESDLDKARALGVMGFPSLVLAKDNRLTPIPLDHNDPQITLRALNLGP
ncbi:MAG: DsbA family protein [Gammaproteobacteria bacterium]|nr:DsbA family protein [Gammaproteobacteria bacterium]MDH3506873.1 DsbA family protein [Gammaproteobacteria bacterium]